MIDEGQKVSTVQGIIDLLSLNKYKSTYVNSTYYYVYHFFTVIFNIVAVVCIIIYFD